MAHNNFKRDFGFETPDHVRLCFPASKSRREILSACVCCIAHYLRTGCWITDKKICEWATSHPDQKISDLFQGRRVYKKVVHHEQKMTFEYSLYRHYKVFFRKCFKDQETVGAIFPSSSYLAKEMVSEIPKDSKTGKRRILEVGPGTGPFTDKIIQRMGPDNELDLVELDETFCEELRKRYKHLPNVRVLHRSILDHTVEGGEEYDSCLSGLPLLYFQARDVKMILKKFVGIIKKGGILSSFEYRAIPRLRRPFLSDEERENLDKILDFKRTFYNRHPYRRATVLRNIPPARVVHHLL